MFVHETNYVRISNSVIHNKKSWCIDKPEHTKAYKILANKYAMSD